MIQSFSMAKVSFYAFSTRILKVKKLFTFTVALSVNNEIMYYKGRLCDQLLHTCVGSQHSVICGKNTAEVMIIQVTLTLLESDCVTS